MCASPADQQFLIQISSAPPKSKVPAGPARLHVQELRFCLTSGVPPKLLGCWEIALLRLVPNDSLGKLLLRRRFADVAAILSSMMSYSEICLLPKIQSFPFVLILSSIATFPPSIPIEAREGLFTFYCDIPCESKFRKLLFFSVLFWYRKVTEPRKKQCLKGLNNFIVILKILSSVTIEFLGPLLKNYYDIFCDELQP